MATKLVSTTLCDETQDIIRRFDKAHKDIVYTVDCSLPLLKSAKTNYQTCLEARNAAAQNLDVAIVALSEAEKGLTKVRSSFLVQTGEKFTKDSDEYVWAGGIRRSEALERAKQTRLENVKADEEKKKIS